MKALLFGAALALTGCTTLIPNDYHHYEGEKQTLEQLALIEAVPGGLLSRELEDKLNRFLNVSDAELMGADIKQINGEARVDPFGEPLNTFGSGKRMKVLVPAGETQFAIAFDRTTARASLTLGSGQRYHIFKVKFDKEVSRGYQTETHTWKEAVVFYNASADRLYFVAKDGRLLRV